MTTDQDEIARGHKGEREWEELELACAKLRAALLEEIVATAPADVHMRERLICSVQVLDAVKKHFVLIAAGATAAKLRQALHDIAGDAG